MKIYLVKRTDSWSYDDYDRFVCKAESEDQAETISPSDYYGWKEDGWHFLYSDGSSKKDNHSGWVDDLNNLTVEEIGTSNSNEAGVILASFNAG